VWAASGDNAGRHYPMVVCASYDYRQLLAAGAALPIAVWSFLTSAYNLVAMGRHLQVDDFLSRVAQMEPPSLEAPELATQAYHQWLQHQTMRALWETGFGSDSVRFWATYNILASVEIFRGSEMPETSLAIRFPIGAGDTYAAAVWMDFTLRLARWQRTLLNAFWTPQRDLLVHPGPPHIATFRELLVPTLNADHVTDLRTPPSMVEAEARDRLGPELAKLVDQSDLRIDVFLRSLI
jgi:type VI secretion system protein ImpM